MELEARQASGPVYRLGRRPNAWQAPEWFLAHADGTFGNPPVLNNHSNDFKSHTALRLIVTNRDSDNYSIL
jgi:hypothetical protein